MRSMQKSFPGRSGLRLSSCIHHSGPPFAQHKNGEASRGVGSAMAHLSSTNPFPDPPTLLVAPCCAIPRDYLSATGYPRIARDGVFGVSTWPMGCDTPSPFAERFPFGEQVKWRCDSPHTKGDLCDTCAIPHENKQKGCDSPLCDTISKRYCAIWGGYLALGRLANTSFLFLALLFIAMISFFFFVLCVCFPFQGLWGFSKEKKKKTLLFRWVS